jgi:hypothetical protein
MSRDYNKDNTKSRGGGGGGGGGGLGEMHVYIDGRLAAAVAVPFPTIDAATSQAVKCTVGGFAGEHYTSIFCFCVRMCLCNVHTILCDPHDIRLSFLHLPLQARWVQFTCSMKPSTRTCVCVMQR